MTATQADAPGPSAPVTSRWWTLAVIGAAQLMVILDNSIVNIARPSAQAELNITDAQRSWVVTAYALIFGALLLVGGRISDLFGHRIAFVVGLVGFGAASVVGGLAPGFGVLVAARALQGVFGALLAPAALSLLTATFPAGRQRTRAFGVFSALSGSGAAVGLLLGGALTEYVGWRWCLYVNGVFAAVTILGALVVVPRQALARRPRLDLPGTATASAGLFCVVFALASAESNGWTAPVVPVLLAGGLVLLVAFVLIQRRVVAPLLPLRIVKDRGRGGAFLTVLVLNVGMFALTLFLAFVLQRNLGFSPLLAGLAVLPMTACIVLAANTVPIVLMPRTGPRALLVAGLVTEAGALFWFAGLSSDSTYPTGLLGPLLLFGLGMGTAVSAALNVSTSGVAASDAGVASGLVTAMMQIGGSVGLALLSSIAGTASASYSTTHRAAPELVALHGYTVAFAVAAGIFLAGALVVGLLVPGRTPGSRPPRSDHPASRQPVGT